MARVLFHLGNGKVRTQMKKTIKFIVTKLGLIRLYRRVRIKLQQRLGLAIDPKLVAHKDLHWVGERDYGGWKIPLFALKGSVAVLDLGVGEELSFTETLIERYEAVGIAVDPTVRASQYFESRELQSFEFVSAAVGNAPGSAWFYDPLNKDNVSGSLLAQSHLSEEGRLVDVLTLSQLGQRLPAADVSVLKMDIEGSEIDLILSEEFKRDTLRYSILCIEFHHRWPSVGLAAVKKCFDKLTDMGFECVWCNPESNEEFTFLRRPQPLAAEIDS